MLKNQILYELETHRGESISGQQLADRYHVSRNAVWKVISSLREDGYPISSGKNRGYLLAENSDILSAAGIRAELPEKYRDLPVRLFEEVDSTNNEAKRMLASGYDNLCLIAAEAQTTGRGRRGKSFFSPAGSGIYLSLIFHPELHDKNYSLLTIAAAVAVLRALRRVTGITIQLKWVNDLFLDEKKVGGILSEAVTDLESGSTEDFVVGIGLNVNTPCFPESLRDTAASLKTPVSRNKITASIAAELLDTDWNHPESILDEYRKNSIVLNRSIFYGEEEVTAKAVTDNGGLVITHKDGTEEIIYGGRISLLSKKVDHPSGEEVTKK